MGAHCTHAPVRLSWRRAAHAHGTTNRTEGEACHRPTRLNEKKVPSDFRPRPRGGLAVVHADAIATNGRGAEARSIATGGTAPCQALGMRRLLREAWLFPIL